jgi:GlpG protein
MRQIATLPDEAQARTLSDHLLTLHVETKVQREEAGWELWVCDEDQVERARAELAAFTANPHDERFTAAGRAAEGIRLREWRIEEDYRRRQHRADEAMTPVAQRSCPLTLALITACLVVAVASNLGDQPAPVLQALHIASYNREGSQITWYHLRDVRAGEVWRLVTPIFIHFGLIHLAFNMTALYVFGRQIEARRGTLRFLALVLFLAVFSNLAQYHLGGSTLRGWRLVIGASPLFGGMSGVLYGLFGYLWMKGVHDPESGLGVDAPTVAFALAWFLVCWTGLLGPIGNVAHAAGLLAGVALGYGSALWRRWLS